MPDVAANKTEELLGRTERKLDRIYKQAAKETKEKYIAYIEKYKKELAVKQAELASGKITDEQYQNWIQRKMFSGRKYQEMARTLAEDLTMTNQKAMSIVNGFLPEAYAMNYNFMAYQMDVAGVPMGASYTLYDRHTVEKLVRERKALLPKPRVDIPKDQKWNVVHIKNAITQGVLQGESIQHISKRLEKVVGMDKASAYRNARTAMTGAQNGGRVDRMKDAQKRGINVWKEWCTTHDGRARDSHLDIDGERVPPDATFSNGCVYPGDPVGDPAEVYNCRCTLLPWLPDYDFDRREVERGIDSISFDEWLENNAPESFEGKIRRIQDEVAQSSDGIPTEAQLKEAGEALAEEYDRFVYDTNSKIIEETDALRSQLELNKTMQDEVLNLFESMQSRGASKHDLDMLLDQLDDLSQKHLEILKQITEKENFAIGQAENVKWLTDQLSKVREVGTTGLDIAKHLNNSHSAMRPIVEEAYSHYPKSWVEKSIARGNLTPVKVTRGYYDDYGKKIAISFRTPTQAQGTALHELAHRFERAVPGIRDAEKAFYERRTAGEALQWLGSGYDKSEVTRFDKFVHAYMGKDYGGSAYELVSMGFQYAYTDPIMLAKDPDMQAWIYGQLLLMP